MITKPNHLVPRTMQEVFDEFKTIIDNPEFKYCVDAENSQCKYSPTQSDQIGCAVGMFMDPLKAEALDKMVSVTTSAYSAIENLMRIQREEFREYFEPWMMDIDVEFWKELQNIHDGRAFSNCHTSLMSVAQKFNLTA